MDAHFGEVSVQELRPATLGAELWPSFIQTDDSDYFYFAGYLSGGSGDGIHLFLPDPAPVDEDRLAGRGEMRFTDLRW